MEAAETAQAATEAQQIAAKTTAEIGETAPAATEAATLEVESETVGAPASKALSSTPTPAAQVGAMG